MKVAILDKLSGDHYPECRKLDAILTKDPVWEHPKYDTAIVLDFSKPGFFRKDGHAIVWAKSGRAALSMLDKCPDPCLTVVVNKSSKSLESALKDRGHSLIRWDDMLHIVEGNGVK